MRSLARVIWGIGCGMALMGCGEEPATLRSRAPQQASAMQQGGCTGQAAPCMAMRLACEQQQGCYARGEARWLCFGQPRACEVFRDAAACELQRGCAWEGGAIAGGSTPSGTQIGSHL